MVSRIFKREIRDWWNHKVDQFVVEKATRRTQPINKVSEGILYANETNNQYEIL